MKDPICSISRQLKSACKKTLAGGHSWHPPLCRSSSEAIMLGGKIREPEVAGGARTIPEVKELVLAMEKWGRSEGIARWEFSSERKERGQVDEP